MLIDERVAGFAVANVSLDLGAQVFQQNCSSCHQINGSGGNIGPQLDGIGNWGHLALTEKILDPNRNISKAFITYSVELNDGKVTQGLFRREEGNLRVYADPAGQEFSISSGEIIEQTALPFTIMPDNFGQIIAEEDFNHLMYYLVEQNNL